MLTKLDGDARGGAALSVKAVTGKPILYASTGEKLDATSSASTRTAWRSGSSGMGDVMTLVEKAERQIDEAKAAELERKIRSEQFTLDDFLDQLQQIRRMGPLPSLLKMMPGDGRAARRHQGRRPRARPPPGDHPVDDARGARQPGDHQRLAPAPHRARVRAPTCRRSNSS